MKIGIWGDSITYGRGDAESLGWVGRLRKSVFNSETDVYNFGVCGDTTEELVTRFLVEANSIHPDIVIFAIGINDARILANESTCSVPLEKYRDNVRGLIKMAKTYTKNIYIVGATKANENILRKSGSRFLNKSIQIYNTCLEELSRSENLIFVDTFNALDIEYDLADGLHPNAQGYEKLYQILSKLIK